MHMRARVRIYRKGMARISRIGISQRRKNEREE
jgi:hypothetical protein